MTIPQSSFKRALDAGRLQIGLRCFRGPCAERAEEEANTVAIRRIHRCFLARTSEQRAAKFKPNA